MAQTDNKPGCPRRSGPRPSRPALRMIVGPTPGHRRARDPEGDLHKLGDREAWPGSRASLRHGGGAVRAWPRPGPHPGAPFDRGDGDARRVHRGRAAPVPGKRVAARRSSDGRGACRASGPAGGRESSARSSPSARSPSKGERRQPGTSWSASSSSPRTVSSRSSRAVRDACDHGGAGGPIRTCSSWCRADRQEHSVPRSSGSTCSPWRWRIPPTSSRSTTLGS